MVIFPFKLWENIIGYLSRGSTKDATLQSVALNVDGFFCMGLTWFCLLFLMLNQLRICIEVPMTLFSPVHRFFFSRQFQRDEEVYKKIFLPGGESAPMRRKKDSGSQLLLPDR